MSSDVVQVSGKRVGVKVAAEDVWVGEINMEGSGSMTAQGAG